MTVKVVSSKKDSFPIFPLNFFTYPNSSYHFKTLPVLICSRCIKKFEGVGFWMPKWLPEWLHNPKQSYRHVGKCSEVVPHTIHTVFGKRLNLCAWLDIVVYWWINQTKTRKCAIRTLWRYGIDCVRDGLLTRFTWSTGSIP